MSLTVLIWTPNQQQLSRESSPLSSPILNVPAHSNLFWHADCLYLSSKIFCHSSDIKCVFSQGSGTNANEIEDARWKWWGRGEESERRRRAAWVGVWLSNKDFRRTSWKRRFHSDRQQQRGPEQRWKDFKQSGVQKWKQVLERGSAATEASLPSMVTLTGWLTLASTVGGCIWLLAHFYTHSPTYLLPPTQCISYTHRAKGAAQLMLIWLPAARAPLSLYQHRTNGWAASGCEEIPTSSHSSHYYLYHFVLFG